MLLVFLLIVSSASAQQGRFFPSIITETKHLSSSIVGDEFEISVSLPLFARKDTTYPVLYVTDANIDFAMSTQIAGMLQLGNEMPRVILVGIGYRTDSLSKWLSLRSKHLTPTAIPDPTRNKWSTGGAPLFLKFIREELLPFIKANYPASQSSAYFGYSYGGLFGLYVLFHQPETFERYIIGSPSIWFDSTVTFRYEEQYASAHSDLPARVFMSAGQLEEQLGVKYNMVGNLRILEDRLLKRRYPTFQLETVVIDAESHMSGGPAAISRGLRAIYAK
jgi:predicted alpha/beta superfamily hydrolase